MVGKERKVRKTKQFSLHEANDHGLDNFWWISKGRKGFFPHGNEVGRSEEASQTIADAASSVGQFSGGYVKIETNVSLKELFTILKGNAFEVLFNNTSSLTIKGIEIDPDALERVVDW
jgi:hypothetical protein